MFVHKRNKNIRGIRWQILYREANFNSHRLGFSSVVAACFRLYIVYKVGLPGRRPDEPRVHLFQRIFRHSRGGWMPHEVWVLNQGVTATQGRGKSAHTFKSEGRSDKRSTLKNRANFFRAGVRHRFLISRILPFDLSRTGGANYRIRLINAWNSLIGSRHG